MFHEHEFTLFRDLIFLKKTSSNEKRNNACFMIQTTKAFAESFDHKFFAQNDVSKILPSEKKIALPFTLALPNADVNCQS